MIKMSILLQDWLQEEKKGFLYGRIEVFRAKTS